MQGEDGDGGGAQIAEGCELGEHPAEWLKAALDEESKANTCDVYSQSCLVIE